MTTTYSVVGLGKLGASMAAAIASRGFPVIGVDVSERAVELLNGGHAPVRETDLEQTITANRQRLRATTSHRDAILNSDLSFVIVPTPSDERGAFSLQYAAWAFREMSRYGLLPILERESGKKCGPDFGLCYSPEFIALGSVIHDFLNPDFNLIGEHDERAGSYLEACYSTIVENAAPCRRMSLENAELAKVALNTFVTTKVTFANMLADLCERLPGGDVDAVSGALGLDRRIGAKYFMGALGYGGPCFPRDNVALSFMAQALGSMAELAETTDRVNRSLAARMVERLRHAIQRGTTIAVLGLAYKPFSHVIEESQGIYLAKALSKAGARVVAYDPLAGDAARAELRDQAVVLDSIPDCLAQADIILITTPDPAFRKLRSEDFAIRQSPVTVVDCWRILSDELAQKPNVRYLPVGRSIDDEANAARLAALWDRVATELG